jgi:hypothetical protein
MVRNSQLTVAIQPEFRKFVAVAGCSYQIVGPMQVLIDDKVVWERQVVNSLTPAEQIEIDIPAGAKSLTLQVGSEGYHGHAGWTNAGFVK